MKEYSEDEIRELFMTISSANGMEVDEKNMKVVFDKRYEEVKKTVCMRDSLKDSNKYNKEWKEYVRKNKKIKIIINTLLENGVNVDENTAHQELDDNICKVKKKVSKRQWQEIQVLRAVAWRCLSAYLYIENDGESDEAKVAFLKADEILIDLGFSKGE